MITQHIGSEMNSGANTRLADLIFVLWPSKVDRFIYRIFCFKKKTTILCALAWACSFLLQPPFIMFQTILGCPASPVPNLVSSRFLMYYLYDYTLYSNTFRHWKSSILRLLWIEQNTFGYLYSWPFWPTGTERGLWEASAGRALKAKLNPLVKSRGACQCSILKGSRMVHWCW